MWNFHPYIGLINFLLIPLPLMKVWRLKVDIQSEQKWSLQVQKFIFKQSGKLQDLNIEILNYNYQSWFCHPEVLSVCTTCNSIHIMVVFQFNPYILPQMNFPFTQITRLTVLFVKKHQRTSQKVASLQVLSDRSLHSIHAPGYIKLNDTSLFAEVSPFSRLQCTWWRIIATACTSFHSKLLSHNWMSESSNVLVLSCLTVSQ